MHAFQLLFTDCNYPQAFVWWIGLHAVMFYFLFADFYKQAYNNKAKGAAKREADKELAKKEINQNGHSNGYQNGSAIKQNGSAKPKTEKPKNGFFGGFVNICQMDHSLLYEDDPVEENPVRRRNVETWKLYCDAWIVFYHAGQQTPAEYVVPYVMIADAQLLINILLISVL